MLICYDLPHSTSNHESDYEYDRFPVKPIHLNLIADDVEGCQLLVGVETNASGTLVHFAADNIRLLLCCIKVDVDVYAQVRCNI